MTQIFKWTVETTTGETIIFRTNHNWFADLGNTFCRIERDYGHLWVHIDHIVSIKEEKE